MRGKTVSSLLPIATYLKDPESTVEYTLDWTDFVTSPDYIISSTWAVSGLSLASGTFTNTTTMGLVAGGVDGTTYYIVNTIQTFAGKIDERALEIKVANEKEIYSLIMDLRLHLGDIDPTSYRYLDKWLVKALLASIKSLQRWWGDRYLVNLLTEDVYRGSGSVYFYEAPPVIEDRDVRPIILMASIIIKQGQLENNSWSVGSWRDAEISVSNIEGGRNKVTSLQRDWDELTSLLTLPGRKLAKSVKGRLPGYFNSEF